MTWADQRRYADVVVPRTPSSCRRRALVGGAADRQGRRRGGPHRGGLRHRRRRAGHRRSRVLDDGPTEAEFALALDAEMRRRGADDISFETIVASGPNGSRPHHEPADRGASSGATSW